MENKNFHFSYGLATGLIVVVIAVIFHILKIPPKSPVQYVLYLPFAIGVIMACTNYAKAHDNYVTFGKLFSVGFKTTTLITLLVLGWVLLSFVLFPEIKDEYMNMSVEAIESQEMSDSERSTALEMSEKMFYPFMIGGAIFGNMVPGLIFSLIGAAVTKKKGNMPPHMYNNDKLA